MGAISFCLEEGLLEMLARSLPLTAFVETGTFRGDTLEIAAKYFTELHSVEMSGELHRAASKRFHGRPDIHLVQGDSPGFLRQHREDFASRAVLYWLDAHWCCADDTAGSDSQSPLLDELQAIGSLHSSSVLLVDDARLYLSPPPEPHSLADWPDFHELVQALLKLSQDHRLMVYNDVVVFYPACIRPELTAYAHKHGEDMLWMVQDAQRYRRKKKKWWKHK